jgi:Na+-transporting NADH:ubiquinone oxidoreductase subunit C
MAFNKDTLKSTIIVAFLMCIVCAVLVSGAAVMLKPIQTSNKEYARNRDVLVAAGMYDPAKHDKAYVEETFKQFTVQIIDLHTGELLSDDDARKVGIDPASYDQRKASKNPELSERVDPDKDIAVIKRQAKYAAVYVLKKDDAIDRVVLPVHGYGLWSTLWGFLAVEGDGNTILGLTFYEHAETPGLGGEVDNPKWKALWPGKKIYEPEGDVGITVTKGGAADPNSDYQVDGLSGATLTSRGIDNLVKYWMGKDGFGPYLTSLQAGEV